MSGKKDQAVAVIVNNLTRTQAAKLKCAINIDKNKIAPDAKGIAFSGNKNDIQNYLKCPSSSKITKKGD